MFLHRLHHSATVCSTVGPEGILPLSSWLTQFFEITERYLTSGRGASHCGCYPTLPLPHPLSHRSLEAPTTRKASLCPGWEWDGVRAQSWRANTFFSSNQLDGREPNQIFTPQLTAAADTSVQNADHMLRSIRKTHIMIFKSLLLTLKFTIVYK